MTNCDKSCKLARMTESDSADGSSAGALGRQFAYWLGELLRREREGTGNKHGIGIRKGEPIDRSIIAAVLGNDPATPKRREEGVRSGGELKYSFGNGIDRVVAAYAYVLGYEDPRILWLRALQLWQAEGAAPDYVAEFQAASNVTPLPTGMRARQAGFERALRDEARRQQRSRAAPKGRPSASPRKKREAR